MYVSSTCFNANLGIDTVYQALSLFKIVILLLIVIAGAFDTMLLFILASLNIFLLGWAVLSGKTRVRDPHANFRNAFAGSSHSSNDVSNLVPSRLDRKLDRTNHSMQPPLSKFLTHITVGQT